MVVDKLRYVHGLFLGKESVSETCNLIINPIFNGKPM